MPEKQKRKAVTRDTRFEIRIANEERDVIGRAAEMGGETASTFVRREAVMAARARLAKYEKGA